PTRVAHAHCRRGSLFSSRSGWHGPVHVVGTGISHTSAFECCRHCAFCWGTGGFASPSEGRLVAPSANCAAELAIPWIGRFIPFGGSFNCLSACGPGHPPPGGWRCVSRQVARALVGPDR